LLVVILTVASNPGWSTLLLKSIGAGI
jgi:hypothetical protein